MFSFILTDTWSCQGNSVAHSDRITRFSLCAANCCGHGAAIPLSLFHPLCHLLSLGLLAQLPTQSPGADTQSRVPPRAH